MRRTWLLAPLSFAVVAAWLAPRSGEACGGTFCDGAGGPQQMSVDQTGENILFFQDGAFMEAHIQILYTGDPERFAWVIPMTAVPTEVRPGSDALFQNLLASTVPTFTLTTVFDPCGGSGGAGIGCDSMGALGDLTLQGGGTAGDGDGDGDGPDILGRGVAGAFEYTILQSNDVDELVQWLDDNDYQQEDDAPPILAEYIDEGFVFAAVKLNAGVGIEEIHPLVVRYVGDEPCIPIRLTRIAAKPDMAIRAFFLGEARWAPTNYALVELAWAAMDWATGLALDYPGVVSQAIDEAGGHAFVTEYAGTSAIVSQAGIHDPDWDPDIFLDIDVVEVIDTLTEQGLYSCSLVDEDFEEYCGGLHPLVDPIVAEYLPVPDGVDPDDFYGNLATYEDQIDLGAWFPDAFAYDLEERVVAPAVQAIEMLDQASMVTRLFTTLSPEEMTLDPMFHANPDLPNVSAQIVAERHLACDGPDYLVLPDGRELVLDGGGEAIDVSAAATIGQAPATGPVQIEVDNRDAIAEAIESWNDAHREGPEVGCRVSRTSIEGLLGVGVLFGIALGARRRRRAG